MKKLILGFAVVIVIAGIAASWAIHHRAETQLRERDDSLRQQAETIASLSGENQRLSNLVEQAKSARPLSQDQLRELARLRGQVGPLRQTGAEKSGLAEKNARLKAAREELEKRVAEEQAAPNYWPKDQLAFAGYGDPESALKTMLWAMKNGEVNSWQKSCTPEAVAKMQQEWDKHGKSEADRIAELKGMSDALLSASTGFRILDQKLNAPDTTTINLSFVGEDKARKFVLKQIDGEWKFHDLIFAGQREPGQ